MIVRLGVASKRLFSLQPSLDSLFRIRIGHYGRIVWSHSLFMIGANGSVRGKKEFEPSSLAAESEPLLGPHLEGYWSHGGILGFVERQRRCILKYESYYAKIMLGYAKLCSLC